MKFTDSHCHLDFDEFKPQLSQLIRQCANAEIHQIIIPAVQPDNWAKVLDLAIQYSTESHNRLKKHCKLFPCLGIHPWFLDNLNHKHLEQLALQVDKHQQHLVAIGETGIDGIIAQQYNNIKHQVEFFDFQLALAKKHDLPVIVHHRKSHQYIVPLLKKHKISAGGVIHAFSGSYQQASEYIDLGFKLGIGGTITYQRATKTINAIKRLPLTSLVLETDAPSMPISGCQGQNNSPLQLIAIFKQLLNIRSENPEVIAQQLENNVAQLFNLTPS
jgi:TatD DNase family protein